MIWCAIVAAVAATASGASAGFAWYGRRAVRDLANRYVDAVAIVVMIARDDPPLAHPAVVAACQRIVAEHHITIEPRVTITTETIQ